MSILDLSLAASAIFLMLMTSSIHLFSKIRLQPRQSNVDGIENGDRFAYVYALISARPICCVSRLSKRLRKFFCPSDVKRKLKNISPLFFACIVD